MGLFGKSRGQKKAENKLGYLSEPMGEKRSTGKISSAMQSITSLISKGPEELASLSEPVEKAREYRSPRLKKICDHYDDAAYNHLKDWHEAEGESEHVPMRERKPFVRVNLAKILCVRVASKLVGKEVFPQIVVDEDPNTEAYFRAIAKGSGLESRLVGAARLLCLTGSVFVRFYVVGGVKFKLHAYRSNYCYPTFGDDEDLLSVLVIYQYTDHDDLDKRGSPKRKWYKAEFNQHSDILYDNPEVTKSEPIFMVQSQIDHGLGFVQGEWFRTDEEDLSSPDGMSLVEDAISFQDPLNYSLSRSQQASDYNQDPQLALNNMDEDEVDTLVRSSARAWNLGREGDAKFIESGLTGVTTAIDLRDKNRVLIQDLTRIILMDPEKMTANAQSGKALEVLHGPMVDLINELRPQFERTLLSLVVKMGVTNLLIARNTGSSPVSVPPLWKPASFNLTMTWPPVFPMTVADLAAHTAWVVNAANNNIISRRTAVTNVQKIFNIADVEQEIFDIENQKSLNPFGMF